MKASKFDRFLAVSGVVAAVLFVCGGFHPDPPGISASAQSRVNWYTDHKSMMEIAAFAGAYFAVVFAFFATGLRRTLRSGEAGESTYSTAALAGGILVAAGSIFNSVVTLASVDAADKGNGAALTTFAYINDFTWLPLIAALAVLYLATGLGGLRTATLPKWLSIVTIVLGVACILGPAGIAAWFATPVWLVVVSVLMLRRGSAEGAATADARSVIYA